MSLIPRPSLITLAALTVATGAIAGLVHGASLLAAPGRASVPAFARIAARTPVNHLVALDPAADPAIPFRDPAMRAAICRFDLTNGPVRLTVDPFARGFAAIGFHSERGSPFSGLIVSAGERNPTPVSLVTAGQHSEARAANEPNELTIVSPETRGFILVEVPAGEVGTATSSEDALAHIGCAGSLP